MDLRAPEDRKTKEWRGASWTAHCGVWWSAQTWRSIDPLHRSAFGGSCGECGAPLTTEADRERTVAAERAGAFDRKIRDADGGDWLKFVGGADPSGDVVVPPRAMVTLTATPYEPWLATHLGFSAEALGTFEILSLCTCRTPVLSGPVSADHFAVRVPDDWTVPIDRGGSLPLYSQQGLSAKIVDGKCLGYVLMMTVPMTMVVRNVTDRPALAACALFGRAIQFDADASGFIKLA